MDEQVQVGSRSWFDKLEGKIDDIKDRIIRLETIIEQLVPRQERIEKDFDKLEAEVASVKADVTSLKAENTVKHKNVNIWLGIGMIGTAIVAVIAGVLLDHFVLK